MGITAFFSDILLAPLQHRRMSWGAIRSDGLVFLRVWDEKGLLEIRHGMTFVRLAFHEWFEDNPENWGYRQRQGHICKLTERIKTGEKTLGYAVMCSPKLLENGRRQIKSFIAETVRPIIGLKKRKKDTWAELDPAIAVAKVPPI